MKIKFKIDGVLCKINVPKIGSPILSLHEKSYKAPPLEKKEITIEKVEEILKKLGLE